VSSRAGYKPHKWHYDQTNGFWAHCNCGFSASSISDFLLRRRMDRHVLKATQRDLLLAQIERTLTGGDA
jgi:hypothetical protein